MKVRLPHAELRRTVDGLADRSPAFALVPVAPVVLTMLLAILLFAVRRSDPGSIGQLEGYALYAVANVLVLLGLVAGLDRGTLAAVAPIRRPSRWELASTLVALVAGLSLYLLTTAINAVLGLSFTGMEYTLADPATAVVMVVGGLLVAPIAEEVLFRGLLLGYLLDRG
jgi:membrane protease YdiL (CAAX protease family)